MLLNNLNRDLFKPFRSHKVCSAELLAACLRICTGLKGVSFREMHLWEHIGRTDKIALITCLKTFNVSDASLSFHAQLEVQKPFFRNRGRSRTNTFLANLYRKTESKLFPEAASEAKTRTARTRPNRDRAEPVWKPLRLTVQEFDV